MFSKKTHGSSDAPGTIVGKGAVLEAARMSGQESVRIDGEYRGEIDIDADLVLGDTSIITGDIHARYIVVAGRVNGNITCDTVLHFASTAQVYGNITAQNLIMDEGSQVRGCYQVGELTPDYESE